MGECGFESRALGRRAARACRSSVVRARPALVAIHRHKMERYTGLLRSQAAIYGKQIRLVRYVPVEVVITLEPGKP